MMLISRHSSRSSNPSPSGMGPVVRLAFFGLRSAVRGAMVHRRLEASPQAISVNSFPIYRLILIGVTHFGMLLGVSKPACGSAYMARTYSLSGAAGKAARRKAI